MKPKEKNRRRSKHRKPRTVLRLPDLEHEKLSVLNSLRSEESKRGYAGIFQQFEAQFSREPRGSCRDGYTG